MRALASLSINSDSWEDNMDYKLLFILLAIFYIVFGVISPLIRNILNIRDNMEVEKNIGGFLAKLFYKRK